MAALWNRAGHYIFMLWFLSLWSPYVIGQTIIFLPCDFYVSINITYLLTYFFLLSFFPRLISAAVDWCLPYLHAWCGLSTNLRCRSETCCTWLAENTGRKTVAKNRHLGTITQVCRVISSQIRHISLIGKKLAKQQYLLNISPQYDELRPTSGWDQSGSLGTRCKFQQFSRLGSVTARHCSSGRQPNFPALNWGRHLYSAGRPSRWALAHISSFTYVAYFKKLRQRRQFPTTICHDAKRANSHNSHQRILGPIEPQR